MEFKDLIKKVIRYDKNARIGLLEKAYTFSDKLLKGNTRISGKRWIEHYLEVADECANLKLDDVGISAALMHGIINKGADKKIIKKEFGDEVLKLLENIDKMSEVKKNISKKNIKNEDLRKVLLAASKDLRALLIKICDKLVNLRELDYLPEIDRIKTAKECMNIYNPLAYRLGIGNVKAELEDLAFKHLDRKNYDYTKRIVEKTRKDGEKIIPVLKRKIENGLKTSGLNAGVEARIKHLYSIHKKIADKSSNPRSIIDIVGIRIITENTDNCYRALQIIHKIFRPLQNRFKDYIAMPKPNGYQSLHTSVLDENGNIFEVQIRTKEMHEHAEEGFAAHFNYKHINHEAGFDKRLVWLKNIVENKENFLDINVGLFGEEIFVFTPQGKTIELPKNSTVIDFAYRIHSDLGNHCTGARVNGNFVSLKNELNNGDIVEVVKSKSQIPSREWLKYTATKKAREKIKQFLRDVGKVATRNYAVNIENKSEPEESLIKLKNHENRKVKLAMCCNPIPGDLIAGIASGKTRVNVHNVECSEIKKISKKIEVVWVEKFSRPVEIIINAKDRPGLFKEILNVVLRTGVAVTKTNGKTINKKESEFSFVADVKGAAVLDNLVKILRKVDNVTKVYVNA